MTQLNGATDGRKPACKLVGTDGNVFSIIGRVKQALKKAGREDRDILFIEIYGTDGTLVFEANLGDVRP